MKRQGDRPIFSGNEGTEWLTQLLMVLTIGVGILGIFQELHTKDGKLTRWGWSLAAAIVLLGAGTYFSGRHDRRAAEKKEKAETNERNRQFRTQMTELRIATQSARRLEVDMQHSLSAQRRQSEVSAALQRQARDNTNNVLHRIFDESNRVAAERIAIIVTYRCSPADRFHDSPHVQEAALAVHDRSGIRIELTTSQTTPLGDGLVFHGFLGDLHRFETFPAWRGARVSIRLSGGDERLGVLAQDLVGATDEEERRMFNREEVTCPTSAMLFLNGRHVLSASGNLRRGGNRYHGYVVNFDGLRVDTNRLPHFSN